MNTVNQHVKDAEDNKNNLSNQPNKILPGASDYNGNEEPVDERSDKIPSDINDYGENEDPKMDVPLPEPEKIDKKAPKVRKPL